MADYILSKEDVQKLFAYLEDQLDACGCDNTLRCTEQWLTDHIPRELHESVMEEMTDMGGYCDCEVLFNCYEVYDIE